MATNDLHVIAAYDDLKLVVVHEGQGGNAALAQATLMQLTEQWPRMTADAIESGLLSALEDEEEEAETGADDA